MAPGKMGLPPVLLSERNIWEPSTARQEPRPPKNQHEWMRAANTVRRRMLRGPLARPLSAIEFWSGKLVKSTRWDSNPQLRICDVLQAGSRTVNIQARNRTWSSAFGTPRAIQHTPKTNQTHLSHSAPPRSRTSSDRFEDGHASITPARHLRRTDIALGGISLADEASSSGQPRIPFDEVKIRDGAST